MPISYYTQHAEAAFAGPNVRARHFRRLDASSEARLTVWDVGGPDANAHRPLRHAFIPFDDLEPSEAQRRLFQRNLSIDKNNGDFEEKNPNLSSLLNTGLLASEYGIGCGGPLGYENNNWGSVLTILDRFISLDDFQHPRDHARQPSMYQHTVQSANQRLARQHELLQSTRPIEQDANDEGTPW